MRRVPASLLAALALVAGGMGAQASAAPSAAPFEPVPLGTTVTLNGQRGEKVDVTVLKVVDPAASAQEFFEPDPGNRYVSVQFRLKNSGTVPYKDSPVNGATLIDTEGQQFDADVVAKTTAGPRLPVSLTITPGNTALGYLTFELPDGSKPATVQFTPNSGFADDVGEWKLDGGAVSGTRNDALARF
ncbi:DUF4352 domain-containing protein [Streptomyces sp. NBC_01351]|uniref:DUF4352 domain-containing protein n=1 Tax=Streptomyces sp. NBC_01351 TaxID=2903833 RepID=UPI002E36E1AB|nr:DUF4352 domain-containing protein [Streptomyces sp. NBC_01351]